MWYLFNHSRHRQAQLKARWIRLYRVAYAWCHDPDLACDLVQETMRKAIKKHHQLQTEQALDAWLFRILANCWRDHCRSSQRQRETTSFDELQQVEDVSQDADDSERALVITQVRKAIAKLPLNQREVVTLVDLEGMAYSEVAEILEIPIGTVMSRLCRARRQLRDNLEVIKKEPELSAPNVWRIK